MQYHFPIDRNNRWSTCSQFLVTASGYSGPSSANNTWDVAPGCSYWWHVQEISTTGSGSLFGGVTTMDWYGTSGFPTISFKGYQGNGTPADNVASGTNPGKFLLGRKYRITRGTWTCCGAWHTESKTVYISNTRSADARPVITDDKGFKPSKRDVDNLIQKLRK